MTVDCNKILMPMTALIANAWRRRLFSMLLSADCQAIKNICGNVASNAALATLRGNVAMIPIKLGKKPISAMTSEAIKNGRRFRLSVCAMNPLVMGNGTGTSVENVAASK